MLSKFVAADCEQSATGQWTCTDVNQMSAQDIPPDAVNQYFDQLSSSQKSSLSGNQLSQVDASKYGDLSQYDPTALKDALAQKGYSINNLQGNLSGTKIEGTNLVLSDGSSYDLKSGRPSICLFLSPTHSK